ncbi:MAG: rhodanese-related sulfurtransferase [Thermodesulfobacteriota bacterium]
MDNVHIILFYKFIEIDDPERFAAGQREFCRKEGLLGKILIAGEGINGTFSGSQLQIEGYERFLTGIPGFADIVFKEETSSFHPFKKLIIRVKKEIIRMEQDLDMSRRGRYITPEELLALYESGEDFVILDTRNSYESDMGKFRNAVTPRIDSFREFPEALLGLDDMKNRKIVTYCTGGIRCEKATAYMISRGFRDVYQLKDGIINFCQKYPNTVWEGKCFVFDERLISDVEAEGEVISYCITCGNNSDRYQNCRNPECDDLVIMCKNCSEELEGCCSGECLKDYKSRIRSKSRERQGYKSRSA